MMRIPAALVSAGVGAVFFAAAYVYYYQPAFIGDDALAAILTTNHSKARAAVSRLSGIGRIRCVANGRVGRREICLRERQRER